MKSKFQRGYLTLFIIGVLLIIVYKTFDNFSIILSYFKKIITILTPVVWGFVIALLFYPSCFKLEKLIKKSKIKFLSNKSRGFSVGIVFIVIIGVLCGVLFFVVPPLAKSIGDFIYQIPTLTEKIVNYLNNFDLVKIDLDYIETKISIESLMKNLKFESINEYALGVVNFSTAFFRFFMSIIISIYILIDRDKLKSAAIHLSKILIPKKTYIIITKYVKMATEYIYKYLFCLILDALIIFVLAFIVLLCFRAKYASLLALLIGVCNLIPYFGAIIATVIASVITCFTLSFTKGIWVAVALIILQQVDANVIQPNLVNNSFAIRPFWVIVAILIGGGLFGIVGILLAVPVSALIKILFFEYVDKKENEQNLTKE